MAEKTILICDRCGADGAQRIQVVVGSHRLITDLCPTDLAELTSVARPLRRARRAASVARKTSARRPPAKAATRKAATSKRGSTRARKNRAIGAHPAAGRSDQKPDVADEVNRLRSQGLSYRQVGDALLKRGIKPKRSARWNPIVLSRMAKRPAA